MELWENILSCIERQVSRQNFDIWFKPTSLKEHDSENKRLVVRVPNQHFEYWLTENYLQIIQSALEQAEMAEFHVSFVVDDCSGGVQPGDLTTALQEPCQDARLCNLNNNNTFSRFVVGFCNQFAHAGAVAVAERPAKAYNPFFIYGGAGLGKTHLMHAIGHYVKARSPSVRVSYMSSECFMNELINSIRYDKTIQFREKYRNVDVLLMDDIQFLAGKERTQEEFFHTFNALYDAQKQIVISSDALPKDIPTLEERLHSRFEWGLIADIQPPDVETKIAILEKKAEFKGVKLPSDVALFIASNVQSNIRELEGSLVRLVAYRSLTGEEITLGLAERVLRNIAEKKVRAISIQQIQKAVAAHYTLKVSELKIKDNSRRIAGPRQVAMFLSRELTGSSLPQIGKEFGGKHHTTVLHSIRKVKDLCKSNLELKIAVDRLAESIR
jgi:chromosomal replication initiator protein